MGADIHIAIEKKVKDKWLMVTRLHWSRPGSQRNYKRFGVLASVRGHGMEPKGIPADASESTRLFVEDSDFHSHSWLPVVEASKIFLETEYGDVDGYIKDFPACHYFDLDGENLDDYRIVFCFDS